MFDFGEVLPLSGKHLPPSENRSGRPCPLFPRHVQTRPWPGTAVVQPDRATPNLLKTLVPLSGTLAPFAGSPAPLGESPAQLAKRPAPLRRLLLRLQAVLPRSPRLLPRSPRVLPPVRIVLPRSQRRVPKLRTENPLLLALMFCITALWKHLKCPRHQLLLCIDPRRRLSAA
jgi:hypothetical protein